MSNPGKSRKKLSGETDHIHPKRGLRGRSLDTAVLDCETWVREERYYYILLWVVFIKISPGFAADSRHFV